MCKKTSEFFIEQKFDCILKIVFSKTIAKRNFFDFSWRKIQRKSCVFFVIGCFKIRQTLRGDWGDKIMKLR